ncbi:hypothetical protein [Pseudomonas umsongensis]|jgi:hypothetical protein|uniref:hypothetical protein n=1 Tax=Pseudomonas umsongensis TaxID=198618 RepID=UPI0015BF27BA|nr:hypothetical protein [Pseudomonas umsongensis]
MEIHSLRMLIIHLSSPDLSLTDLREAVVRECPQVNEIQLKVALHDLQHEGLLLGYKEAGEWMRTAVESEVKNSEWPEYSQEFANRILAIEREEFVEIDVDVLIAELDVMIQKARARKSRIRKRVSRVIKDAWRPDQS